jgi:hypothetical protein
MSAVDNQHAGVASGVNNAVARIASLLAIALFGVLFARTFDTRVRPRLEGLGLTRAAMTDVERELPKMAGADVQAVAIEPRQRAAVREAIDDAFVSAFRVVMIGAVALALAAAAFGGAIRQAAVTSAGSSAVR